MGDIKKNDAFIHELVASLVVSEGKKHKEVTTAIVSTLLAYHKENVFPNGMVVTIDNKGLEYYYIELFKDLSFSKRRLSFKEYYNLTRNTTEN